jgi:hypothetical protein
MFAGNAGQSRTAAPATFSEWATIRPEQPDASQSTAGSATPNLRVGRPNIVRIWHARLGSHKRNQADLANLP